MDLTDEKLDELQRLSDAATPGKWKRGRDSASAYVFDAKGAWICTASRSVADASFIAASRTALPALIAEVRRGRGEAEKARAEVEALRARVTRAEVALEDFSHGGAYIKMRCTQILAALRVTP